MLDGLKSHPDRSLIDHLLGTARRAEEKGRIIEWSVLGLDRDRALEMLRICALSHDFAKACADFQDYLKNERRHVSHAPLSSLVCYLVLKKKGFDRKLSAFAYFTVRYHHGTLPNFGLQQEITESDLQTFQRQFGTMPRSFLDWFSKTVGCGMDGSIVEIAKEIDQNIAEISLLHDFSIQDYVLLHTLYSILVSSDREDAALKDSQIRIERKLTLDLLERYVSRLPSNTPMDGVRKQFGETVKQRLDRIGSNIVAVTAPTGIGKTLANLRLALSLADDNSLIVYALPFINIIDQTIQTLHSILSETQFDATTVLPYHHLADPRYEDPLYEQQSIQHVLINGWRSQIVVTTFVSLFESLFTNRRVPFFHRLLNSVIVLDEVQSIPHRYWKPLASLLETLSRLNCKIILCTATQPMLFENVQPLVQEDFHLNRTRVQLCGEIDFEGFKERVLHLARNCLKENKSLLVVLNTIREARETYEALKALKDEAELYYLSSHVVPKRRIERINAMKKDRSSKVCVSTQVVEAGVDLSFDVVVRDEAPLDSVFQVAGRCNRNFSRPVGEVYLYRVRDERTGRFFSSYIYDPLLIDATRKILKDREVQEKDFFNLSTQYFSFLKKHANLDRENLMEQIEGLRFEDMANSFRLIDRNFQTVSIFIEYDEEAKQLREQLKNALNSKMEKFEKIALIARLLKRMSSYTIDVPITSEELKGALLFENGFMVMTHDNLELWYDEETGFKRSEETMIF
ncbi:hypothetical protein AS159_05260 [Thermotoga sp. Ku-13t]|uniref:CRISPR-associated helicase Cas3' n=1 Tax=Thermotoga sp. Ku-13t TaxID=1755813 RepID=UPI0016A2076C|nr:CRISPR-associated helicase Cas3' [Thermotoga sp. Ku-13t]KAF2957815.1 hypothetical protein AS159_05260 [Thermotoga sp. Ku-13t]